MKTSFAIFGAVTAVNLSVVILLAWFGFQFGHPNLVEMAADYHRIAWAGSYVLLLGLLVIDLVYWTLKK